MRIIKHKIVVTRKKHRCCACLQSIEVGQKMRVQVNTSDGLYVWKNCMVCDELLSKHRSVFVDPCDDIAYEGCVADELKKGQTTTDLLEILTKEV